MNIATFGARSESNASTGCNIATGAASVAENMTGSGFVVTTGATRARVSNAFQGFTFASTGDVNSDSVSINDGDTNVANRLFNVAIGGKSQIVVDSNSPFPQSSINIANAGATITNPGSGVQIASDTAQFDGNTDPIPDGININPGLGQLRLFSIGQNFGGNPIEITADGIINEITSTAEHKYNIQSIDTREAYDMIMQFNPVTYQRRGNTASLIEHGFTAEDVAHIAPELVTRDTRHKPRGISFRQIHALLVATVQEQQRIISAYEERITALERELRAIQTYLRI